MLSPTPISIGEFGDNITEDSEDEKASEASEASEDGDEEDEDGNDDVSESLEVWNENTSLLS